MTILLNEQVPDFDDNEELQNCDRAQPLAIEPSDHFVMLTQQDGTNEMTHCILIERRDLNAFIDAIKAC